MSAIRAALVVLVLALLAAFASSAVSHRVDYAATIWLQHGAPFMDVPAAALVFLGNAEIVIPAVAVAGGFLLTRDRTRALEMLTLAAGLALMSLLAVALKHVIVHPGPPPELQRHVVWGGLNLHQTPFSFPSGHALRTTMLAGLLLPRHWSATILVLCMMAALVYLGDHWMTDVFGGLCLGWASVEIGRGIRERLR